jgi:AbrB family looped-hinge helix DNA binding protein
MRTTIDRAGRLVVPKAFREALGLQGGAEVEIVLVDGRIEIEPTPAEIRLERAADGHLVAVADREMPVLTAERVRSVLEQVRR